MNVEHIMYCECGAITITVDGENYSMSAETAEKLGIQWENSQKLCNCDHCVNHWGIDLCACGSGETPEECTEGFQDCGVPYQTLGEVNPSIIDIIQKRGFV